MSQGKTQRGRRDSIHPFEALPHHIFLDSCIAQALRNYDGEAIPETDRIHRVTDGIVNVDALRSIFLINERELFEWIESRASMHTSVEFVHKPIAMYERALANLRQIIADLMKSRRLDEGQGKGNCHG